MPNNTNIPNSIPLQENPEEIHLNLELSFSNEQNYNIKNIEELDFLLKKYSSSSSNGDKNEIEDNLSRINEEDKYKNIDITRKKTTGSIRNIPIKKQLEIIDYVKAYCRNIATKKFDLEKCTITYWMKMEGELKVQKNKDLRITVHKDPKLKNMI